MIKRDGSPLTTSPIAIRDSINAALATTLIQRIECNAANDLLITTMDTVKATSLNSKVSQFLHLIPGTTTVQLDSPSAQLLVHGIPTSYSLAYIGKELTTFNTGLVLAHPPRWLRPEEQRVGKKASIRKKSFPPGVSPFLRMGLLRSWCLERPVAVYCVQYAPFLLTLAALHPKPYPTAIHLQSVSPFPRMYSPHLGAIHLSALFPVVLYNMCFPPISRCCVSLSLYVRHPVFSSYCTLRVIFAPSGLFMVLLVTTIVVTELIEYQ